MSMTHKTVLEQANAAIRAGDFEAFLEFCTDDTVWTFVGDRILRGKDAVRDYLTDAYRVLPRFSVHRMVAEGDVVTAIGEITLTDDQGQQTHHDYCDVWRLRDGQLAELQAFVIQTPLAGQDVGRPDQG